MKNMISLLVGAIVAIVGLILLIAWWNDILLVIKGIVPGVLILVGAIVVIAGISELKDMGKEKKA